MGKLIDTVGLDEFKNKFISKILNEGGRGVPTGGTANQILRSNGDGTSRWDSAATSSEIGSAVTSWLNANVPTGTTVAIDKSLTVENAAAEAKTTGQELSDLKNTLDEIGSNLYGKNDFSDASVTFESGGLNTAMTATTANTARIRIAANGKYSIKKNSYFVIDPLFEGKLAVYQSNQTYSSSTLKGIITENFTSGIIPIPDELYASNRYIGGMFRLKSDPTQDITTYIDTFKDYVKYVEKVDVIQNIEEQFPSYAYDFKRLSNADNNSGWRVGSYNNSGVYSAGSGNAITTNGMLLLDGNAFFKFEFTGDYVSTIRDFDSDGTLSSSTAYKSGYIYPITNGHRYAINISGFGTAAQEALNNGYADGISLTVYRRIDAIFRDKANEFERFTITNDRSWGAIGVTTAANVEPQNPVTVKCIVALPDTYNPTGAPVPLIMFSHGAGGYITDDSWYGNSGNFLTMIRAFTSAGFAVFDVDNTQAQVDGFADWGCLPLMTSYIKAWEFIKRNYNVQHDLFIVSDSMGTCASLNMLKWYGNRIRTAIQIAPRPMSKYRYATQTDEGKKEMLVAYGIEPESILTDSSFVIPDDSVFTDDYKGFFHYDNIEEINGKKVLPNFMIPPIKVLVGGNDTQFLSEVREFYNALRNSGNYVDYREVQGANHNISFLPNYPGLTTEAINWLKRFVV